jgi:hypothetical protein
MEPKAGPLRMARPCVAEVEELIIPGRYIARCSCSWRAPLAHPRWGKAMRDALDHIGQQELPDPPPVLPIF